MHIYTHSYTYLHTHKCILMSIYKYLVWCNSPCLPRKFLINIYNTICDINVHSFFCRDVILLWPWTCNTNDGCLKEMLIPPLVVNTRGVREPFLPSKTHWLYFFSSGFPLSSLLLLAIDSDNLEWRGKNPLHQQMLLEIFAQNYAG